MERQKDAFEERYASKMTKILTKISKETDRARRQAASTKTSPFQVIILRQQQLMLSTGIAGIHLRYVLEENTPLVGLLFCPGIDGTTSRLFPVQPYAEGQPLRAERNTFITYPNRQRSGKHQDETSLNARL